MALHGSQSLVDAIATLWNGSIIGLLRIQARLPGFTWLHPLGSTWLHMGPLGSTWFLHVSTDSLPTSTDPLLTLYWTASDLPCVWTIENSWEHSKLRDVWIGFDHRPPLQLEHRWAVLIIKPFGTLKISVLQRFLVIVTTNIWILHCYNISRNCYNLFILLHRLFDVTILLQQLYVVTILLHRIACNCYNVFATGCNNGRFHCYACYNAMLQAFQTPLEIRTSKYKCADAELDTQAIVLVSGRRFNQDTELFS